MRMAVIDGIMVINIIEADTSFRLSGFVLIPSNIAGLGWTFSNGVFSPPAEVFVEPPTELHAAWLRAALAEAGQADAVNAAVNAAGPVKAALWEFATTISRLDNEVIAIATALNIDLRALFARADEMRAHREGG